MANRENGEVSLVIGDKTYTLAMTINAMVALEDMFSTPSQMVTFQKVSEMADAGSIKHLRAILWAVLQEHHPDVTIEQVSTLVRDAGGLGVFTVKLLEMAKATMADPKDLEALGIRPTANPQPAQGGRATRGTGGRSTSELAKPA